MARSYGLFLCNGSLDQLDGLHNRDHQNGKAHCDGIFRNADGGKTNGICKEGYFNDCDGRREAALSDPAG